VEPRLNYYTFSLCVPTHIYLTPDCHNLGWWMDWLDALLCRHRTVRSGSNSTSSSRIVQVAQCSAHTSLTALQGFLVCAYLTLMAPNRSY
jgi:hypothetical protein